MMDRERPAAWKEEFLCLRREKVDEGNRWEGNA